VHVRQHSRQQQPVHAGFKQQLLASLTYAAVASRVITMCNGWSAASAVHAAAVSYVLGTSNAGSLANLLSASPAKHSTFMSAMSSARVQPAVNSAMDASACLAAFARRKAE